MNELIASVRADLTDRRLLPVVALVAACLVAAIAYAALGGSGSPSGTGEATIAPVKPSTGISVTSADTAHAVAETPDGVSEQTSGRAHNPFKLQSAPASASPAKTAASSSSSTTSSSSSSSGETSPSSSGSTGSSGEGSTETKTETKKKSATPKRKYDVAIEFGTLPPGTTPETAELTPFTKLKLQTPLPSAKEPLLVFRGVTAKGRSATFTLVGEAILSGTGACLPSAAQCEAVDIKPGETEQLSYLAADGQTTVYELRVLSITPVKPTAKEGRAGGWAESKAGRALLEREGLQTLPFLHYSKQPGVLVFSPRKASAARARTAVIATAGS